MKIAPGPAKGEEGRVGMGSKAGVQHTKGEGVTRWKISRKFRAFYRLFAGKYLGKKNISCFLLQIFFYCAVRFFFFALWPKKMRILVSMSGKCRGRRGIERWDKLNWIPLQLVVVHSGPRALSRSTLSAYIHRASFPPGRRRRTEGKACCVWHEIRQF